MVEKNAKIIRIIIGLILIFVLALGILPLCSIHKLYADESSLQALCVADTAVRFNTVKMVKSEGYFPEWGLILICVVAFSSALLLRKTSVNDILDE